MICPKCSQEIEASFAGHALHSLVCEENAPSSCIETHKKFEELKKKLNDHISKTADNTMKLALIMDKADPQDIKKLYSIMSKVLIMGPQYMREYKEYKAHLLEKYGQAETSKTD